MRVARTLTQPVAGVWGAAGATSRGLAIAVAALAPAAATLLLVHFRLHASIGQFVPSYWNDQVGYWHRILSFAHVGFNTGYYAAEEVVQSPIGLLRFGVNGPWFPMVYGTIGAVFGWHLWSSIVVNMAVLAVGFAAFLILAELDLRGIALAGLAVLTLWPVLLYIPTASQETLQQALAMVLAAILVRAIRLGARASRRERIASIAFVVVCAVMRFSWAIVLAPLLVLYAEHVTWRRVGTALIATAVLSAAMIRLTDLLQPPGTNSVSGTLGLFSQDPLMAVKAIIKIGWANAKQLFTGGPLDPTALPARGIRVDNTTAQSWEVLGLVVLALAALVKAARTYHGKLADILTGDSARVAIVHLFNLGLMVLLVVTLYLPYGYYRVLGANLLLSMLVMVALRRMTAVIPVVMLNVIMLPAFLNGYGSWSPNFTLATPAAADERAAFAHLMRYEPHAPTPWCNTVLYPLEAYDWHVTLVPAGFGVAYSLTGSTVALPPKSRYIFLPQGPTGLSTTVDAKRLRLLGRFPIGALYENPQSLCFARTRS
jgi:hypothetical protein